ncbi:MAG TPA: hypothetical protein VHI93_06915 [Candidatus Thermoplasmatota archaeon]|nr:hypothetical protein [Candidatus Thermoplasmatota archaeon]
MSPAAPTEHCPLCSAPLAAGPRLPALEAHFTVCPKTEIPPRRPGPA